jgi:hypothetical protein
MKSAGAEAYETGMPNLNQTAKLDTDLAKLMELRANYLRRSIRSRRHLVDAKAYRISIKYEHGFFEFEVLLPSNRVVDHWKWSEAQLAAQVEQGPTKAKDSPEIAEARRAIVRDLAGKLGLMHG